MVPRDIPEAVLGQLIDYCYTSTIEVSWENVQPLLAASGQLQLLWVQEVACEFLQHHLSPQNCLGVASLADTHSCPALYTTAETIALQNFPEVVDTPDFLQLPHTQLEK